VQGKDYFKLMSGLFESKFLLASLHIEAILRGTNFQGRRAIRSSKDGAGLADAYGVTLEHKSPGRREDKTRNGHSHMGLSFGTAVRDGLAVLCAAVEMEAIDFDPNNVPSIDPLLHCCQGLTVE